MDTFSRDDAGTKLVFDVSDSGPADGPVVVLLHGWPQNRHQWDGVVPHLTRAGFRVLAPDQRGYSPGARPAGRRAYTQSRLVEDVVALIDAAGAEKVHLVGHDWGAFVGWAMASKHPERLHTLTAVSVPHPQAFVWAMPRGQLLKSWYMLTFQLPALPERALSGRIGESMLMRGGMTREQVKKYAGPLLVKDADGSVGMTTALNWYRALPLNQREHGYGRPTTVPTTFVWSDHDVAISRKSAEATRRFVDAPYRFSELSGVSHWIPDEVPDALAELILDRVQG